jgi:hypothetical protein
MNERESQAYFEAIGPEAAKKVRFRRAIGSVQREIEARENFKRAAAFLAEKFPSDCALFDQDGLDAFLQAVARDEVPVAEVHRVGLACIYFTDPEAIVHGAEGIIL